MPPCCLLCFLVLCYFPILLAHPPIQCPLLYHCKNTTIYFPLTDKNRSECGLQIRDCDDSHGKAEVQLGNHRWYSMVMQYGNSIVVQDEELEHQLSSKHCSVFDNDYNISLPISPISFHTPYTMIMYKCIRTLGVKPPDNFHNHTCPNSEFDVYYGDPDDNYWPDSLRSCSKIQLPIQYQHPMFFQHPKYDLFKVLTSRLYIEVVLPQECQHCYDDICLYNNGRFSCAKEKKWIWKVIVVSALVGVGVLFFLLYCYLAGLWKNKSKAHQDFEDFLKSHGPLTVRRYSYSDIKRMTKSFKEKLGQGGYGEVFKGKLDDGSLVAVKMLSESKGNGEEFINEVASISRTSHVNIVTLLGFCFEGSKRALIYEFVLNGSLEKFIYETNPSMVNEQLNIEILYQIAIGVARGLEYLHRGCNTRILHFDIKPHNILLDENFCPKISDFGLAKICPKRESIISMIGTRGTIGYIAPEVFNRHFGGVSHKSDVYSYGMMVLEMVSGRKNINVEVEHTSEIYFPHWIYKRLELNEEFALRNILNDNDKDMIRKMVIVSLWCIQTNPVDRPTMGKVVEMLEGRVETLQIPPKPFLSSPPRSPSASSIH